MIKLLDLTFAALLSTGSVAATAAEPATETSAEKTVSALYTAFSEGNMPKIMSMIATDATWVYHAPKEMLPFAGTYNGRDGVAAFFSNDAKYVEVKSNDVNEMISLGDKVVVLGLEHGVVRATGKSFKAHWTHIFTVKDGQIIVFEETIDSAAIYQAFLQ